MEELIKDMACCDGGPAGDHQGDYSLSWQEWICQRKAVFYSHVGYLSNAYVSKRNIMGRYTFKKFKFHAFPFLRGWHKLWLQTTLWIIELRFGFGLRGRLKDVPWFCTSLPSHRFRKKYIHLRNVFLGYFGMKILKQPQSKIWNIFPRYEFTWEHSFHKKTKIFV